MTLFDQFDSLLDLTRDRLLTGGYLRQFVPAADLMVKDGTVTVMMDVPGIRSEDLQIELHGNVLTVRGERPQPHIGEDANNRGWFRFERGYGKFERTLQVPDGLDPDAISASLNDGVLTLLIPQPEAHKPRQIRISTGTGSSEQPTIDAAPVEAS